ncbi:MAG: ABC transporter ATP-binding protein [Alphaproteobacteria bacterium]|nr:ABC transporter ATP-binding protein [Alphaproteobacteria bacterium]
MAQPDLAPAQNPEPNSAGLPENAIEVTGVHKTYRGRGGTKTALTDLSLAIPRGSIFGLLGPNGAGKSTFINILAGLVTKTSGSVRIWETDLDKNPRQAAASIGIVPQELNLDAFFTPFETLEVQAGLYGVPKEERHSDALLEMVGLSDKRDAYARTLSGGMRRRLLVAKAMVHSPPILVLDEPTAGVDIELRAQLWRQVKKLNEAGVTIVLTTHYLEEAEELCDRIGIINHGRLVACEDTPKLLSRLDTKTIRLVVDSLPDPLPRALTDLGAATEGADSLVVTYKPSRLGVQTILDAVQEAGIKVRDLSTEEADLEDVFLQLTGSRD